MMQRALLAGVAAALAVGFFAAILQLSRPVSAPAALKRRKLSVQVGQQFPRCRATGVAARPTL
jgi:hypothetical protein